MPWLPGWLDAWLPGCLDAWMPGCLAAWLPGCLDAWMPDLVARIWQPGSGSQDLVAQDLVAKIWKQGSGYHDLWLCLTANTSNCPMRGAIGSLVVYKIRVYKE